MEPETARGGVATAVARRSCRGEEEQKKDSQTVELGSARSDVSGRALRIRGTGDFAAGRGADDRAALPGPRGLGKQLRRVEEPVGLGRVHHARPEAMPDNGAHHGAHLQLVDDLHAPGNPGQTCRGHYFATAGAAWHSSADTAQ